MRSVRQSTEELAMRDRRSRHEIMIDILRIVVRETNITRIVYGANINFKMAQTYMAYMVEKGLVEPLSRDGKICYRITDKGQTFLQKFSEFIELE